GADRTVPRGQEDRQTAAQDQVAVHRLRDGQARPRQAGRVWRRRQGHADRHLPGDGRNGLPVGQTIDGGEVRQTGDERQVDQDRHGGERRDRGAGRGEVILLLRGAKFHIALYL